MLGTTVGPYQILRSLGAGGMGEVFLGHDPRLRRNVALKRLSKQHPLPEHAHPRVLREARAAARLNHPNVAGVYDVIEDDEGAVIVMEYVAGESLRTRLARGPLAPAEVIAIGCQLADAVAAAHAHAVIHRDLKPSNIQLTDDGLVKVLDFGIAKVLPAMNLQDFTTTTGDASVLPGNPGTPIYMAPEQLLGGEADERSDIYSLGVVLFEMVTGSRPYAEHDVMSLALAMSTTAAPAARAVNLDVPQALSDVIAKALEREPANRHSSAATLGSELARLRDGTGGKDSRRWFLPAVAVLLVAGAIAGVPAARSLPTARPAATGAAMHSVLGVPPSDNRSGDIRGDYTGAALASIVASNFGSIPGVTVLPRDNDAGVTHQIRLKVHAVTPTTVVEASLRRGAGGGDVWTNTIRGDPLVVERQLLAQLADALARDHAFQRPLSPAELARVRKLPTSSTDALVAFSEGRALLDRYDVAGNVERAIELFRRATELDSHFALAFAALGEALWNRYTTDKRPDTAAAATGAVTTALALDGDLAPVSYALGLMQSQTGQYEQAAVSLRRALVLQPENDETRRLMGRVLSTLGDHAAAVAELNRAVALRPVWSNYYSLGYVLYESGDYQGAIDAFRKTTELRPTFASAYQMLGTMYHMLGNLPLAIGNYEHAVRLGANASAYANLGFAYYAVRRYEPARQAYANAIAQQPRRASLHKSLADVYMRLGRTADAKAAYRDAIALAHDDLDVNPRDALAVVLIANCEARLGQRAAAERHTAEATALAPSNRDVWIRAAKAYTVLNDVPRARGAVTTAVSLGYEPTTIAGDDELTPIGRELEAAVTAGLAARSQKGAAK